MTIPVGAAEGCDLLILFLTINIKRSQPSAAPTLIIANCQLPIANCQLPISNQPVGLLRGGH
jgi:hypothetical protein